MSGLTAFQTAVARLFFSLPASDGFLLAGGGALLATGLTTRPTEDLDFFGERGRSNVTAAREQLEAAAVALGWTVERLQVSDSFARLHIRGEADLLVDIAIDASPGHPPIMSMVGPTFDQEELAGRKLMALFDRAEARDFADVFVLAKRFDRGVLLERAAEVDRGFDGRVLAAMMRTLDRFADDEIATDDVPVAELRAFFAVWADDLDQPRPDTR
jgi:predicted nucleotidyltransferase component of viral defense system